MQTKDLAAMITLHDTDLEWARATATTVIANHLINWSNFRPQTRPVAEQRHRQVATDLAASVFNRSGVLADLIVPLSILGMNLGEVVTEAVAAEWHHRGNLMLEAVVVRELLGSLRPTTLAALWLDLEGNPDKHADLALFQGMVRQQGVNIMGEGDAEPPTFDDVVRGIEENAETAARTIIPIDVARQRLQVLLEQMQASYPYRADWCNLLSDVIGLLER